MVVETPGTGRRGRHSARPPAARQPGDAPPTRRVKAVLAILGVIVVIAAGTVAALATRGPSRPAAQNLLASPGASAPSPAGRLNVAAPARVSPVATASSARAGAFRKVAAAGTARDPLGATATAYVSTRAGTVTAAVYDIRTGQTWQLGLGRAQAEASVVKLDVLETLLAERGHGGADLSASDHALTEQMIEDSDNAAATSLWYEAGGATGISSFNRQAGLTATSPSSCVVCSGFALPGWGLSTTTPTDQITLLRQLVGPSEVLTDSARDFALSLMENVTPSQRWGVSGGVPAQVTVALKNGWLPLEGTDADWQINSIGWISGGGRDYLMAVLTTGNPSKQYGIDTIDRLAAMAWQNLG
jgi:beta-lactamase class A